MPIGRQQERELHARVLEILNRYDLSGLAPGQVDGAPAGEYEPEARPIESVLVNRGAVVFGDIREVWRKWFSDDLWDLPADVADSLVAELNAALDAVVSARGNL